MPSVEDNEQYADMLSDSPPGHYEQHSVVKTITIKLGFGFKVEVIMWRLQYQADIRRG